MSATFHARDVLDCLESKQIRRQSRTRRQVAIQKSSLALSHQELRLAARGDLIEELNSPRVPGSIGPDVR